MSTKLCTVCSPSHKIDARVYSRHIAKVEREVKAKPQKKTRPLQVSNETTILVPFTVTEVRNLVLEKLKKGE